MTVGKQTIEKAKCMLSLLKDFDCYIVMDRESTAGQPNEYYGKITEISAIKVKKGKIVDTFDTLIDPEIKIPKKIIELTGISNELVKGCPKYPEVIKRFLEFAKDADFIIGHNVWTDIRFINFFANKLGKKFEPDTVDTLVLSKYLYQNDKTMKFNLEALTDYFQISNSGHHRAMADVMMTYELFKILVRRLTPDIKNISQNHKKEDYDYHPLEFELRNINIWDKIIGKKKFSRVYLKLYHDGKYDDVYYDYIMNRWNVKELNFQLPDDYDKLLIDMVCSKLQIPISDFYDKKKLERSLSDANKSKRLENY